MITKLFEKVKGWWHNMFDYSKVVKDFGLDMQTSKEMLDAFQEWARIFNRNEPWINEETASLHVAKTICERVSKSVTIEYKSTCDEPYIDKIYQKFLKNIRRNTEYMTGKSCVFFRPYYTKAGIKISVIQADKFIPVKFDDDGELLGCIIIDQLVKGTTIYTRLEYNELVENTMIIKNIAYKGDTNGTVLSSKISLTDVEKWKDIKESSSIEGIDRLIGGFASMKNSNTIDNSYPGGVPIYYNAIETLKEIDKQYSRILWEYEGSELAVDIDESMLERDKKGNTIYPKGKKRLFRKLIFEDTKDKNYNIFSPEIRYDAQFQGLNELLRLAELQCGLSIGTLCRPELLEKTATEVKTNKQDYYVTVTDIQSSLQHAFDDLIYGIYVLCKLYNIPVKPNYITKHDWDDSIIVDKESVQRQSLLERNNGIIDDIQYIMDTKGYSEEEAIDFYQNIQERKSKYQKIENEIPEE